MDFIIDHPLADAAIRIMGIHAHPEIQTILAFFGQTRYVDTIRLKSP
jgi:hypothetical protein